MRGSAIPVPVRTAVVGNVSVGVTAYSVTEGSAKPISRLTITNQQMTPQKSHGIVVVTNELARMADPQATELIRLGLRDAVGVTTDSVFLSTLISGLSTATSTGSTAEALRADIANLLRAITTGQTSRLFLITTPLVCKSWSMLTDQKGVSAFPELGPLGGVINKIPVLVSERPECWSSCACRRKWHC